MKQIHYKLIITMLGKRVRTLILHNGSELDAHIGQAFDDFPDLCVEDIFIEVRP